jgi:hypothetical protein
LWWLLTQHFGLRGRQEHHEMNVEDFSLQKDDNGIEFVTFAEGVTNSLGFASKTLKTRVKLNLNFTLPHAITYTNPGSEKKRQ